MKPIALSVVRIKSGNIHNGYKTIATLSFWQTCNYVTFLLHCYVFRISDNQKKFNPQRCGPIGKERSCSHGVK